MTYWDTGVRLWRIKIQVFGYDVLRYSCSVMTYCDTGVRLWRIEIQVFGYDVLRYRCSVMTYCDTGVRLWRIEIQVFGYDVLRYRCSVMTHCVPGRPECWWLRGGTGRASSRRWGRRACTPCHTHHTASHQTSSGPHPETPEVNSFHNLFSVSTHTWTFHCLLFKAVITKFNDLLNTFGYKNIFTFSFIIRIFFFNALKKPNGSMTVCTINNPLLLIGKCSQLSGSRFPLIIWVVQYHVTVNVL